MQENLPEAGTLKPVFEFGNFLTRKLYTYNSASCIIAYLGYLKGYTVYSDAANDPEILSQLDHNYEIMNQCMCLEFGYDPEDQKEFAALSRDKFTDRTIVDTVARNAREPQRKIGPVERVTGPLLLQLKYGMDSSVLEKTLAAMILYRPAEETEWNRMVAELTPAGVLSTLAGLTPESPVFQRVLSLVSELSDPE
jgi:mannitol-1-phosphate 5-dehydrogenase